MKHAQLVARADSHGVYIAATETTEAQYYSNKNIVAHTPVPKPRPQKAIEMAYKSFVYARGRFTPGGLDKYLEFRKGREQNTADNSYTRRQNGALAFVNSVMHMMSAGPSHGENGRHIHSFRPVGGL